MSPRKKKAAGTTEGVDTQRLAAIGAISEVANLKRKIRSIEKAYPGTAAKADLALQQEQMAAARAVRSAGNAGNKKAFTHAKQQEEQQTPARIAAQEETTLVSV